MMNFINNGYDEALLKSLQTDERIDQEILEKAIDKSKLVQVERQVQGKNKMFTRKQWVKAGDVQSTDKIIDGQQIQKDNKKPNEINGLNDAILSDNVSKIRDVIKDLPDGTKISVRRNSNLVTYTKSGKSWKREDNGNSESTIEVSSAIKYSSHNYNTISDMKSRGFNVNVPKVIQTQPTSVSPKSQQKSTYFKADQNTKNTVNNIAQKMGNDKLLSWCHSVGVTWTENDHKGINIMRAKMALAQAVQEGKVTVGPKTSGKTDDSGNSPTLDKKSEPLKNQPSKLKGITDLTVLKNRLRVYIKNSLGDKFSAPKYGTSSIRGHKPIRVHGLNMNIEGKGSNSEKLVLHHTSDNTDTLENLKSLLESNGINVTYYLNNPNSGSLQIYSQDIYRKK